MHRGPVDLPRLGAQCADTHAHLNMLDDPAGALERATIAGVMLIVTVADATEAPRDTYAELPAWRQQAQDRLDEWDVPHGVPPQVRIIVGAHPHNAKDYDQSVAEEIRSLAADPRTVGIGEIGLDFHYDHSPRDAQRHAFREQLALARDLDMPVVIHMRDAMDEGIEILEEIGIPDAGCVLHCFTEGPSEAQTYLEMGCHLSFAGPVTFKKADKLRAAVATVPLDRLLVETDSPFLAPEPHRGRTNEPALTTLTVAAIAEVRAEDTATIALATIENARELFKDVRPG